MNTGQVLSEAIKHCLMLIILHDARIREIRRQCQSVYGGVHSTEHTHTYTITVTLQDNLGQFRVGFITHLVINNLDTINTPPAQSSPR